MSIVGRVRWSQREKLARLARKARDPKVVRRAMAIRQLAAGRELSRVAAIERVLATETPGVEVFYQDEADVDLNPRIGQGWRRRGKGRQEAVPTPGKNRKAYLAGALHARTGRVIWTGGLRKDSALFLSLLEALERSYPRAERLVLILDNYGVHKSRAVQRWLAAHPRFELLFQPAYHPWVNCIERLWKAMRNTVTRNHRCRTLEELCAQVVRFLEVVQPFPGAGHALATSGV